MPGYLDKVKELEESSQALQGQIVDDHDVNYHGPDDVDVQVPNPVGDDDSGLHGDSIQQTLCCEISEISEKRSVLLDRLRTGQVWLLKQHELWQSGDSAAVDDAEFSRVWNGWWELDRRLRVDHGFQGCIYDLNGGCPDGFPCQGCADLPVPSVVAQLELAGTVV